LLLKAVRQTTPTAQPLPPAPVPVPTMPESGSKIVTPRPEKFPFFSASVGT